MALGVIILSDTMVGGDEVQDETQMLTDEEIKEIKEEVDTREEETDVLIVLLKKTIDTIMIEEFFETNKKMNLFRNVLAQGILTFAQNHTEDKAKMDLFVDAFRAAWKVYRDGGDEKNVLDVFMNEMNNELWTSSESKDKEV